ncbi:MAG: HDOD domain-containing protein [Acidimicrobiales bacterium]
MGLLRRTRSGTSLDQVAELLDRFELPSFPQVAAEALQHLADPDVKMAEVANVLERDPGLSVHFLRLANSASLGLRSSVDSLDRAVVMLGRNQVESILIGHSVAGSLTSRSPVIEAPRFWGTAALRAVLASQVALVLDPSRRSEHFTAGLLQDMALLVLSEQVNGYDTLLAAWYSGSVTDLVEAENDRFGWDHATVGAVMCRTWNFPEKLVIAVEAHHDDDDDRSPSQLVAAFHEVDDEAGPTRFAARCAAAAELAPQIDQLLDTARSQVEEVASVFAVR